MSNMLHAVRTLSLVSLLALVPAAVTAQSAPPATPSAPGTTAARDEFVPIGELPPEDTLPAAPLLVAAYAVAWGALLVYVWMLWRRLGRVEQELRLARRSSVAP